MQWRFGAALHVTTGTEITVSSGIRHQGCVDRFRTTHLNDLPSVYGIYGPFGSKHWLGGKINRLAGIHIYLRLC